jgi:hypothetical protein
MNHRSIPHITCSSTNSTPPPSRRVNPFATCWTRPGALSYHFGAGQSAERLVSQLVSQEWRGAIVGPHGSGKSTLLESLKPALRTACFQVRSIALLDRQRRLPAEFWSSGTSRRTIIIIDGYEQLGWFERLKLNRFCHRANHGLLVTTHSPTRIPTLLRLAPDEHLVQLLVAKLATQVSTPITYSDVAASHACHGSNVREIFFDLYDRHEQMRRAERVPADIGGDRALSGVC